MQFYLIKRGEQEYQAPSLQNLKQWAEQGRLKKSDQIFDHVSKTWILASDFKEIQGAFPSDKTKQTQYDWQIKRKNQLYPVVDKDKLEQWAKEGKLSPLDILINQKTKQENMIKDLPEYMALIPDSIKSEYLQAKSATVTPFDLSLFDPIYDFIRLYMICEKLKLFEVLKKSSYIPSLDLDFVGFEKIGIYQEYLIHLQKHLNEKVIPFQGKIDARFKEKYELWLEQLQKLVFILDRLALQYQNQEVALIEAEEDLTNYQIKENIHDIVVMMKEIKQMLG